eukprot:SM000035S13114  [mRNA]  locus=s35:544941:545328:+ [translate_table: standard]
MREAAQEKLGELLAAAEAACEALLSELATGLLHALPGARTPRALIRGLTAFDTPPPPTAAAARCRSWADWWLARHALANKSAGAGVCLLAICRPVPLSLPLLAAPHRLDVAVNGTKCVKIPLV